MSPKSRPLTLLSIFVLFSFALQASFPFVARAQTKRQLERETSNTLTEKRVALVIGNGAYTKAKPLPNPANDAADMAAALKALGFEVISGVNQSKRQIETLIRDFGTKLAASGGTGLFYYAGHGIQVGGENYIVPVEADIPEEDEVAYSAVPISLVLIKMSSAKNDLNIVILDACRNNPFARSWRGFRDGANSDGLAKISPPTGTLVLYATEPGKVASDGTGRNGLFTESLLKQINKPGLEYDQLVKAVSADVWQKSGQQQLPWKEGNALQDFYFAASSVKAPTNTAKTEAQREQESWNLVKDSSDPGDYRLFLNEFPNGANASAARIRLGKLESNPDSIRAGTMRKSALGIELVWIPPGGFMMGSTDAEIERAWQEWKAECPSCPRSLFARESPQRRVVIPSGFWMGKYEVTQRQWQAVMGNNPSGSRVGDDFPVENVSWKDVQEFITKLNAQDEEFEYRLPSEAEWEYAARAGTKTPFAFGDSLKPTQANFGAAGTVRVGSYAANAWGLYDMHGNVWEWVQDVLTDSYDGLSTDGSANLTKGDPGSRVLRGGSWSIKSGVSRSAFRSFNLWNFANWDFGLRLVARTK